MDNNHIIKAGYTAWGYCKTRPVFQYDYGQVLSLEGFTLPPTFEVHFGRGVSGQSITMIGSDNQVDIPDECLRLSGAVTAWLFLHDAETDGETRFVIEIPVNARAEISNQEPTPVQQDAITQAIAALNAGVRNVEEIADTIPDTIEDALTEAKESGEFDGEDGYTPIKGVDYFDGDPGQDGYTPIKGVDYFDGHTPVKGVDYFDGAPGEPGDDGYSPSVAVSEITGGHQVTITDKTGSSSFDVMDGQNGDPGTPGTPGQDGVSPTLSVADITGGHRITITDKTGTRSVDVMDGAKGDDGISPVASVSKSGNTATITITDKTGTTSATVSDGAALIDDTAGAGDTDKAWSADKNAGELSNVYGAINDLSASLPTEETAQELLENEFYNAGLTDTTLAVIGMIFNNLPQDEPAVDVVNSLSLECERLQTIYENWMSERGA